MTTKGNDMSELIRAQMTAKCLAENAKARSSSYAKNDQVDFAFAFGYLTGTLASILMTLTPNQLAQIEKNEKIDIDNFPSKEG